MPSAARDGSLTATEAAVLGLLARGPRSGYDLVRNASTSVGYFWAPAQSRIYAVLPRLADAGLVARREVAQDLRPDKSVYRMTAAGRAALRAWLDRTPVADEGRNAFLLKVFFGDLADREALCEQIRERRRKAEELLVELRRIDELPGATDDVFPTLTRRYGEEWARGVIRWAKAAEKELSMEVAGSRS